GLPVSVPVTGVELLDGLARRLEARGLAIGPGRPPFILRDGGSGPRDTSVAILLSTDGRPLAVAKIARGAAAREALRAERSKLKALHAALPPLAAASLPVPLDLVESEGLTVLLESHLPGRRL